MRSLKFDCTNEWHNQDPDRFHISLAFNQQDSTAQMTDTFSPADEYLMSCETDLSIGCALDLCKQIIMTAFPDYN